MELEREGRFSFGENWELFLRELSERKIHEAERSLQRMLDLDELEGRTFLDIGSGSGLFSLAARRLGAEVHSFDLDPRSVGCTRRLRERFFPDDPLWKVEQGSILDDDFIASLGTHDIVYSWGVLHHTGALWEALDRAQQLVATGGTLFIAVYNDQGWPTVVWKRIKHLYNRLPSPLRILVLGPAFLRLWGPTFVKDALRGSPLRTWKGYDSLRGMSPWRNVVDWVGGHPFEAARPEELVSFFQERGFRLERMETTEGHGCNELVLRRRP